MGKHASKFDKDTIPHQVIYQSFLPREVSFVPSRPIGCTGPAASLERGNSTSKRHQKSITKIKLKKHIDQKDSANT